MADYKVTVNWAGYSRGRTEFIVEADSEEEAIEKWENNECTDGIEINVRDDTESEEPFAEAV